MGEYLVDWFFWWPPGGSTTAWVGMRAGPAAVPSSALQFSQGANMLFLFCALYLQSGCLNWLMHWAHMCILVLFCYLVYLFCSCAFKTLVPFLVSACRLSCHKKCEVKVRPWSSLTAYQWIISCCHYLRSIWKCTVILWHMQAHKTHFNKHVFANCTNTCSTVHEFVRINFYYYVKQKKEITNCRSCQVWVAGLDVDC